MMLSTARQYLAAGLSVLPVNPDGSKSPAIPWTEYQHRRPTDTELMSWFVRSEGIGVVCGEVSGGLEVIDFDDTTLYPKWAKRVNDQAPGLLDRLPQDLTPRGAPHFYYRCQTIEGNLKLARDAKGQTRIETRGEGGWCVVAPTAGRYHPKGTPYVMQHGELTSIPTITAEERAILLDTAREFNAYTPSVVLPPYSPSNNGGTRPGDLWAMSHSWQDVLEPHGWRALYSRPDGFILWQRPGKNAPGGSATTGHAGHDVLYIFSSNAVPFEAERGYGKFTAYALLNHGGDFSAAAATVAIPAVPTQTMTTPAAPEEETSYHLTDTGNAELLAVLCAESARYDHRLGHWLIWQGQRWQEDVDQQIRRYGIDVARERLRQAADCADKGDRQAATKWAAQTESLQRNTAMLTMAQALPPLAISGAGLDANPWLLNVQNGTIDLRTGDLRPHLRSDLITKIAPVDYDQEAKSALWERFLDESTGGDKEVAEFLARAVGYSMTGLTTEERLFFVHGPAASGKSTFIETIKAVLGDYALTADFETFLARTFVGAPRNDIARLVGARFVASIEVDEGKRLAEGLLKTITGGDTVTARFMYKEAFEFAPQFTLWLCANHKPTADAEDSAMWRRITVIPFAHEVPPEKRDTLLKQTLRDTIISGPAVLAWAVRGCLEWQQGGLRIPASVQNATESYRQEMDPLLEFIEECCTRSPVARVISAELTQAYQKWAKGTNKEVYSSKRLMDKLRNMGCQTGVMMRVNSTLRRYVVGLGLIGGEDSDDGQDEPPTDEPKLTLRKTRIY